MSVSEPSVDAVQPDSGQGDAGTTDAPYAEYLSRIPEEVRGDVEPVFKEWDASVTRRFQEAAEYRNTWKPYEEIGLHDQNPENLKALLEFQQAVDQNPQGVWDWAQQYAQERGLVQQQEQPAQDSQTLDFTGFEDPNQQLQKLLEEQLNPLKQQLQDVTSWREQVLEQAHQQQVQQQVSAEIERLKADHAGSLPKDVQENFEDIIERFGQKYAEPGADPKRVVERAWADFQSLAGQLQTAALQEKVDQPPPAESGGQADVTPPSLGRGRDALRNAERYALEQLRANRSA